MPAVSQPSLSPDETQLEIKNILLVDDDEALAGTLKKLLESRNYLVTVAPNGADALHEVLQVDFDVIICDLLMPRMPGDMFYLAVKKTKPHLAERFLFITGNADNPKVENFLKDINALVIFKPVLTEELVRGISLVLKRNNE